MGGGVGKAISGLVSQAVRGKGTYTHTVVSLETPEKSEFVDIIENAGCNLLVTPSKGELKWEIEAADIVQVEFWNHPAIVRFLCDVPLPAMRLIVWCHVSGLSYPAIPSDFMKAAHRFIFTSACSLEGPEVQSLLARERKGLDVISSGGGLETLPQPARMGGGGGRHILRAGYLGSLNFSKLHPDYVDYIAAVRDPGFCVRMIGDETNREVLEHRCHRVKRPGLLEFAGYRADIATELVELDVLVYLLNPNHYGTAENALLEAMAMGVVPIVMDNAAERHIVEHGDTGIVVRTPDDLAAAIDRLSSRPDERVEMGRRAASVVRERYRYGRMERAFSRHYNALLTQPKQVFSFARFFGAPPADWFRAFYRDRSIFLDDGNVRLPDRLRRYGMFERTKGSVFHFLDHFPHDPLLGKWAGALRGHMGANGI